jgi:hypothetical protein
VPDVLVWVVAAGAVSQPLASVSRTLPLRVRRRSGISSELTAYAVMEVIRTFQDKVVIILVERYSKLVEKTFCPKQALEWHLKFRAPHKSDSRCPSVFCIHGKREMDVLELDGPVTSEYADHAGLSTRVVEAYADRVCSAAVEDGDGRSCVNQGTKCPVTCLAEFQAHINSRPKDRRVALLPIRKETVHGARLADADNNLVCMRWDELSDGTVASLPEFPDLGYQVTRVVGCGNHFAVFNGYPHSCPAL